jgi:hypothetical protein
MFAWFRVSGIWVVGTLFPKGGWITQENALLTVAMQSYGIKGLRKG